MRLIIILLLFLTLTTTTSATTTSIAYTVNVGNFTDGPADPTACSTTSPPLPTCNLRSAWALCLARIHETTCPSSAASPLALSCTVTLPAFSTSEIRGKVYGTVVNVTAALATWASLCQFTTVKLSMVGTTATATAAVTGDQSSASLVVIQQLPFVSFSLSNVNVSFFGNNVSKPAGAVALNYVYSASFSDVAFRHNVGNMTGGAVVVASAVSTLAFTDCVFEGNSATYMGNDALGTYATGGALTVTSCTAGVTLLRCHFVDKSCPNGVTNGGAGGAAFFSESNYVSIAHSSFIGNSVVGDDGLGGALFMQGSTNIALAQVAFTNSSVVGDYGCGGALYMQSSTNVSLTQVAFDRSSVVGDHGAGGALYLERSTYVSLAAVAFMGNSAGKSCSGGAIYMGQVGITAHHCLFASHLQFTFPSFPFVRQGVSYISIGGLLPIYETCLFCDAVPARTLGFHNALVEASTVRFLVTGYYVTVSPTSLPYCGDYAFVGNYKYGYATGCSPYSNTEVPGVDGAPPYYHDGSAIAVNITRYNVDGNPYISLMLFPRAVRADGKGSAGCAFDGNHAGQSGGAIYVDIASSNVFIMDSTFTRNSASVGGAVTLNDSNSRVYFYSTKFTGNWATTTGGAVALTTYNLAVQFHDCVFDTNAAQYGGAIYMSFINGFSVGSTALAVVLSNLVCTRNVAMVDGGAVYADSHNALWITGSRLEFNSAGRGGGLFAANAGKNNIQLSTSHFTSNRASASGGAVYLSDANVLNVSASTGFASNHVNGVGGAIAMTASSLLFGPATVIFQNNSAGSSGAGIWISSSSASSVIFANATATVLFTRNSPHTGALYWIADTAIALIGPSTPFARRLHFTDDISTALATQSTQLVSNHSIIHITSYDTLLHPPPQLALVDYYGNINTTDFATVITATVLPGYHCGSSGVGYLSGVSQVTATAGVATFNHLAAYCYPAAT